MNRLTVLVILAIICIFNVLGEVTKSKKFAQQPRFDRRSENITVIIGSLAVLPCYVNNLGDHTVSIFLFI